MRIPTSLLATRRAAVVIAVAIVTGGLASYPAFFGAADALNSAVAVLAITGIAVFLVAALCVLVGSHLTAAGLRLRHASGAGALCVGIVATAARLTILDPLTAHSSHTAAVDAGSEHEYWELSTGSRLAHLDFAAVGATKRGSIVFLHGGPGAYSVSLEPTTRVISQLRADGYDVHFYDQVGSGLSQRLNDPSEYTVERHVADLEAIRQLLRADRLILVGSSWGATLAAHYMRRHSEAVAAAIFSGPGVIYPDDWTTRSYGRPTEALSAGERELLAKQLDDPRLSTALKLVARNPEAARSFLPDQEADRFFDAVIDRYFLRVVSCPRRPVRVHSSGYGFWSNTMTGRSLNSMPDPRADLRRNETPVLVLRGKCEYMRREVAAEYAATFAAATLVEVEDAGHMIYWEQPEAFLTHVRSFLERGEVQRRLGPSQAGAAVQ